MKPRKLKKGDVVQIINSERAEYVGAFLVVTQSKSFGAQGYLHFAHHVTGVVRFKGLAFLRVDFENIEYVGKTVLILNDSEEEA